MAKDIVCSETELSKAANNITEYADYLSRTITSYVKILSDVQEKAINDDLICSKLADIATSIKPYATSIPTASESIASNVIDYLNGVEQADKFVFPGEIIESIGSITSNLF